MSMLSSAFRKVSGQRLSDLVAAGAVANSRNARQLAGGSSLLLLAAIGVGVYLISKRKG